MIDSLVASLCVLYVCMHAFVLVIIVSTLLMALKVKYFDQKRVYDAYKRKLEKEGYQEAKHDDA